MPVLNNCELHYCKLDPSRPSTQLNKKNPTWEIQMRTTSKSQKEEWMAAGIKVTAVRSDEEGPIDYWRANLRKKSIKADGEAADPPKVINGKMKSIDPNTIGNGSIGNVRIFQYDYKDKESGVAGKATVLMGVQVTNHIVYTPKERNDDDDFGETDYTVVDNEDDGETQEESDVEEKTTPTVTPKVNTKPEEEF